MNRPILTAEQMPAAEAASGVAVEVLMDRAGRALAEAIRSFSGPRPTLFLCGPGNNGGDGRGAARMLADRGWPVRVLGLEDADFFDAEPAPLVVDCLFGTGLSRGLDEAASGALVRLAEGAQVVVAADLPSGVASDDGAILSPIPDYDLTVAFGALKPSHRLMPANTLTRIARTFLSRRTARNDLVTRSGEAPPPMSRKFAGSPPANLIMSSVAIARPAPLTMQPISPSRPT